MIKSENLIKSLNPRLNLVRPQLTTLIGGAAYKSDTRLYLEEGMCTTKMAVRDLLGLSVIRISHGNSDG